MGETSNIEWTGGTWNPWHGCHKVSAECKNCYMFRDKKRYGQDPNVVVRSKTGFYDPLKWTEPKTIFTCSWSDFFIEEADPWRDEAFAIMALTPQHTYQILTKRPDRMLEYFTKATAIFPDDPEPDRTDHVLNAAFRLRDHVGLRKGEMRWSDKEIFTAIDRWPLPNVWLGISAGDQETANERIPLLLQTPAALRFLSLEPLLGPIDLTEIVWQVGANSFITMDAFDKVDSLNKGYPWPGLDWVITGGESGPKARPSHPDWFRTLRDQCQAAGVPFFFKQWGEWAPPEAIRLTQPDYDRSNQVEMGRVGKKAAGRHLDGRTWDEMPEPRS